MGLKRLRAFVTPEPGEEWNALAKRALPGEAEDAEEAAVQKLKSWNLHLFVRNPPGQILGSDVIFVEPPREGDADPMRAMLQGDQGAA